MKKYVLVGMLTILLVLISLPASAAEKVKIKLPNGIYMYDSEVQRQADGSDRVGFEKFFVVLNNNIYSSTYFINKFGISKLNTLFGDDKKYKILCGGEVVGTKYNLKFDKTEASERENATFGGDESYSVKNIKEGPLYGKRAWTSGSSIRCMAVPEKFKEPAEENYYSITKIEIENISKIIKDKLFDLIKKRKELASYKLTRADIYNQDFEFLDKIRAKSNATLYIGTYWYDFKTKDNSYSIQIVFGIENDDLKVITSNYDDTLESASVEIFGMLDVDGCGERELIIGKTIYDEVKLPTELEIYKQKIDGNWIRIKKINLGE